MSSPRKRKVKAARQPGDVSSIPWRLLTVKETCELLKIGRHQLWTLTKSGEIPSLKLSPGCVRYCMRALEQWITEKQEERRP